MTELTNKNEEKRLYRFFVPYLNNHGQELEKEKRDDFINVIEENACKSNRGYTTFEARGGFVNQHGDIIKETITVIETYGKNPLPPERIGHCANYLAQESLIVTSVGSYEFMDYKGGADITRYKLPDKKNVA